MDREGLERWPGSERWGSFGKRVVLAPGGGIASSLLGHLEAGLYSLGFPVLGRLEVSPTPSPEDGREQRLSPGEIE